MIIAYFLELDDVIDPDYYIRPLVKCSEASQGGSDEHTFIRWKKVRDVLGPYWYGRPLRELNQQETKIYTYYYEIVKVDGRLMQDAMADIVGELNLRYFNDWLETHPEQRRRMESERLAEEKSTGEKKYVVENGLYKLIKGRK